jgi:hypothetical protein
MALASLCSPSLQTLHSFTNPVRRHQEQFNHKGKIDLCVLTKAPTKVCIRKGSTQQPVQLFDSAGDVSLRLSLSARSIYATAIHFKIARGNSPFRERAPPV